MQIIIIIIPIIRLLFRLLLSFEFSFWFFVGIDITTPTAIPKMEIRVPQPSSTFHTTNKYLIDFHTIMCHVM